MVKEINMDWSIDWPQVLANIAPLLAAGAWLWNRLDKKFELIISELKEMRRDINTLDIRISKLETAMSDLKQNIHDNKLEQLIRFSQYGDQRSKVIPFEERKEE